MGDRRVMKPEQVKFKENGLVPAVVQDQQTGQVLMLAYMNRESLQKTLESGRAWYWSRERQQLWMKGEGSGNVQDVLGVAADCDQDALLLRVHQQGRGACHEGDLTCFHYPLNGFPEMTDAESANKAPDADAAGGARKDTASTAQTPGSEVLDELSRVVLDRQAHPQEGSYTTYLFQHGLDKILKKVGEEASEVIIAAKGESAPTASDGPAATPALTSEMADLVYHLLVLLADRGVPLQELFDELATRRSSPDTPPKPPKPPKASRPRSGAGASKPAKTRAKAGAAKAAGTVKGSETETSGRTKDPAKKTRAGRSGVAPSKRGGE